MGDRTAAAWSRSWSHPESEDADSLESELEVEVVHAEDGQWICRYEYPHEAEAVQSGDNGFIV